MHNLKDQDGKHRGCEKFNGSLQYFNSTVQQLFPACDSAAMHATRFPPGHWLSLKGKSQSWGQSERTEHLHAYQGCLSASKSWGAFQHSSCCKGVFNTCWLVRAAAVVQQAKCKRTVKAMLILKPEERSKNTDSLFDELVLKLNRTIN